jgi:hypothetical protein
MKRIISSWVVWVVHRTEDDVFNSGGIYHSEASGVWRVVWRASSSGRRVTRYCYRTGLSRTRLIASAVIPLSSSRSACMSNIHPRTPAAPVKQSDSGTGTTRQRASSRRGDGGGQGEGDSSRERSAQLTAELCHCRWHRGSALAHTQDEVLCSAAVASQRTIQQLHLCCGGRRVGCMCARQRDGRHAPGRG